MVRTPLLAPVAALVLVGAPASAPAAEPSVAPKLSARLSACATGAGPAERFAVFTGAMPPAKGADRLRMRFVLERRDAGGKGWSRVAAPTFGAWMKSRPGVSGFVYTKRVEGLTGPADYRAVIHFRWIASDGRVVRAARRTTASCEQPDPRPNLTALGLRPTSGEDGPVAELLVHNDGAGDLMGPVVLILRIDGVEQPPRSLASLAAGAVAVITFPLGDCAPGTVLEATIDPSDGVDEVRETDNRLAATCSATTRWTRSLHSEGR